MTYEWTRWIIDGWRVLDGFGGKVPRLVQFLTYSWVMWMGSTHGRNLDRPLKCFMESKVNLGFWKWFYDWPVWIVCTNHMNRTTVIIKGLWVFSVLPLFLRPITQIPQIPSTFVFPNSLSRSRNKKLGFP